MSDLKTEIRAAFEQEQAPNPPPSALRAQLVAAVSSRTLSPGRPSLREPNMQWLAVAAAIVIGSLIVVTLMSTRLAHRGTIPAATPKATPDTVYPDYGTPPAGVPLFYVQDPKHSGWYIAFDWNGAPRGTIKLATPLDQSVNLVQAPDGSAFFVSAGGKTGGDGQTLDRLGKPQANYPVPVGTGDVVWANDSRHLCSIAFQGGHYLLSWHVPTYTDNVAVVAKGAGPELDGIGIAACAFATDQRAVLVRQRGNQPTELWVIQLGDGRVLVDEKVSSGIANVVASPDGRMIAENSQKSVGFLGPAAASTTVRDLSTGATVKLDPSLGVLAFSADDKVVLVSTQPWVGGGVARLATIDLDTGAVMWRYDGPQELTGWFTEPFGAGFAVMFQDPKDSSGLHPTVNLIMVFIDNKSYGLPGRFVRP